MSAAAHEEGFLPIHRIEALSDGIYAVAMTLLVIDLKLPEGVHIHSEDDLVAALAGLMPRAIAWIISFMVLAIFWAGHHRVFAHLRRSDGVLTALNLLQLAFVTLMPFSSALSGEHGSRVASQVVFSANMALLATTALVIARYVHRHPELGSLPMPIARYRGARLRIAGVILISVVAVVIAALVPWPGMGNMAFMLMAVINPMSRRLERRAVGDGEPLASA